MSELDSDLRGAVPVHEVDQPRERSLVLGPVHAGAARCDATFARHANHLCHDQRRAAQRLAAQVHKVEVADEPVDCGVHVHRRDDHAVGQLEVAQLERSEHRWHRRPAFVEPAIDLGHELGIARLEIPIGHAPASSEQVEGELERLLARVLRDVFEPLEACLRGCLRALDHRPSLGLVSDQGRIDARVLMQARRQRKRVLHRELGS